jgi:hypothetical protein
MKIPSGAPACRACGAVYIARYLRGVITPYRADTSGGWAPPPPSVINGYPGQGPPISGLSGEKFVLVQCAPDTGWMREIPCRLESAVHELLCVRFGLPKQLLLPIHVRCVRLTKASRDISINPLASLVGSQRPPQAKADTHHLLITVHFEEVGSWIMGKTPRGGKAIG